MKSKAKRGSRIAHDANVKIPYLQPPEDETDRYKTIWASIVEDFPAEHFRESDRGSLHSYIVLTQFLEEARVIVEIEGPLVMGPKGNMVENPALTSFDKISRNLLAHARTLKITPTSRLENSQVPKSKHKERELAPESSETVPGGMRLVA